jgi:hypothetical protein
MMTKQEFEASVQGLIEAYSNGELARELVWIGYSRCPAKGHSARVLEEAARRLKAGQE